MADSCVHGNESSDSTGGGEFLLGSQEGLCYMDFSYYYKNSLQHHADTFQNAHTHVYTYSQNVCICENQSNAIPMLLSTSWRRIWGAEVKLHALFQPRHYMQMLKSF
jgi:hypothetical protein